MISPEITQVTFLFLTIEGNGPVEKRAMALETCGAEASSMPPWFPNGLFDSFLYGRHPSLLVGLLLL